MPHLPPGQDAPEQVLVPHSVRLLLELCADGVVLTAGGRLPRAVVRRVQEQRPSWAFEPDRQAHTEEDLLPLAMLHDLLRAVRLLRLVHGRLSPTKAAADDVDVVSRLRAGLFDETFHGQLCRLLLDSLENVDEVAEGVLVDAALLQLGPVWTRQGAPLNHVDVRVAVGRARHTLLGLDAVATSGSLLQDQWSITATGRALVAG